MSKIYKIELKDGTMQRCFDCVEYNCSNDIKETCARHYVSADILKTCLIRRGKPCKDFVYGGR